MNFHEWANSCLSKNKYSNPKEANKVRVTCEKQRGVFLRVYFCKYCGGYHLTSKLEFEESN